MIKVIKTEADYEAALAAIEELIDLEPPVGSREAERLELLAVLVKDYEDATVDLGLPSPLDAIRFRMEQQGLTQRDLIPFIGSRSKVSEVLAGKRSLTLPMIRALHSGLGIPAHVLLQEADAGQNEESVEWDRFPLPEMVKRGWVQAAQGTAAAFSDASRTLEQFFAPVGPPQRLAVLFRRTAHVRGGRSMDRYALAAWTAQVMRRAMLSTARCPYAPGSVTRDFLVALARMSPYEDGPRRARDFLADHGIALVIEPQLPKTNLDGAAVLLEDGSPVIGLTLRYDRVDNFWFTLMHELAHIALHLGAPDSEVREFYDDLDVGPSGDHKEVEADTFAGNALIPDDVWASSPASKVRAVPAVHHLAQKLHIHPAIVAGRMRHQFKDFRVLSSLVGQGEIRRSFPEVSWS